MITREIKILKKIRHPFVIQLYQIIETTEELYLIMEHANAGELFDYIVRNGRVDDVNAAKFFRMILEGVEYLHSNGVCHRDLKPENLLLEKDTNSLKIIDFGLSNMYTENQKLKTACGSPCYAAPEMIAGKDYNGLEVDIWSCGVILYAMACGYLPFEDKDTNKLYNKILNCQYHLPTDISDGIRDLISKILNINPAKRYTMAQIRAHPWYKSNVAKSEKLNVSNSVRKLNKIAKQKQGESQAASKELKILPHIILEMAEKFKIPVSSSKKDKGSESSETIGIEATL